MMRVFCNSCGLETNHDIKAEYVTEWHDVRAGRHTGFWEKRRQRLLICAGCESASLEVGWTAVGDRNPDTDEQYWSTEFFPKRTKHDISEKRFKQLPDRLDTIYRETIQAYNTEALILAAVGLRSLVEGICKDQGIGKERDKLINRIDGLKSILPEHIVEDLHEFRFMGNEAVHELESPTPDDLQVAIEICEDLLNYIYELDYKIRKLSSSRNDSKDTT